MNAQELKEKLLKELPIGSDYDIYKIGRIAREIIERETSKHLNFTTDKNNAIVTYQSNVVAKISVARKRVGREMRTHTWNWSIANYKIKVFGEVGDTKVRIEEIKSNLIACENHRVEQIDKNVEFTKRLMSLGITLEEIKKYVQYMDTWTHRHEVFDKIEKGE